jgi:hypothetical protein
MGEYYNPTKIEQHGTAVWQWKPYHSLTTPPPSSADVALVAVMDNGERRMAVNVTSRDEMAQCVGACTRMEEYWMTVYEVPKTELVECAGEGEASAMTPEDVRRAMHFEQPPTMTGRVGTAEQRRGAHGHNV